MVLGLHGPILWARVRVDQGAAMRSDCGDGYDDEVVAEALFDAADQFAVAL